MKRVNIFFDIDGTIRSNVDDKKTASGVEIIHPKRNDRIVELARILNSFKNARLYAWSGGGADYARRMCETLGIDKLFENYYSKTDAPRLQVDIAIDDQQAFELGNLNLIVHEK